MVSSTKSLFALTAGDLMSQGVVTVPEGMPLREAARRLAQSSVHGVPVVDGEGRCVGVLSVTDLARWAVDLASPHPQARDCTFQERRREASGRETVLCTLLAGTCLSQRPQRRPDGKVETVCVQPQGVCADWQIVEEALPTEDVRHYMTADPVTVDEGTPIRTLARRMLDAAVHRVIVVDQQRPVGVVSGTDLLAALAYAEETCPGRPHATRRNPTFPPSEEEGCHDEGVPDPGGG
jgi:CBS domain-containing protein